MMKKHIISALKSMFHRLGLDIIRIKNSPEQTLCGLRSFPIQTATIQFSNSMSGS